MKKKKLIKIPTFRPLHRRQLYYKVVFWVFFTIMSIESVILLASFFIFHEYELTKSATALIFITIGFLLSIILASTTILLLNWLKVSQARGILDRSVDDNNILLDLHAAVAKSELLIYYQPQVNLLSGKISGVEALVRWEHKLKGFIEPSKFIILAEQSELIIPMGNWILRMACIQNKAWIDQGFNLRVAVNLSPIHFKDPSLIETISEILEQTQLPASNLELEITETSMIEDMEGAINIMSKLRNLGILISMDDFGTGYSSLSNLDRFPIQKLKIDKAFVHGINPYDEEPNLAYSIIEMARKLGLITIAEGIETEYQKNYLADLQCDEGQGYYFGKPVPPHEFIKLLKSN